ncbi:MAG: UbiA family prenyltransferase [Candidatus Moraniibacteriota bacterium]
MFSKKITRLFIGLARGLRFIESLPITLGSWVLAMTSWIIVRFFLENWIAGFPLTSMQVPSFFFNLLLSFSCTALIFLWFLSRMARVSIETAAKVSVFAFVGILIPPIVDFFVFQGQSVKSFYIFDGLTHLIGRYLTFFGDRPDFGITAGVRVEVALFTLLSAGYVWWKTHNRNRSLAAAIGAYTIFFFLGTLPSWITLLFLGWQKGFLAITGVDVAGFFLTPEQLFLLPFPDFLATLSVKMALFYAVFLAFLGGIGSWKFFPREWWSMVRNARFPQLFYHSGLVCVGMALALVFNKSSLEVTFFTGLAFIVIQMAVWMAWLTSVVVNDCFDIKIDQQTNSSRPLPHNIFTLTTYRALGGIFFVLSLVFAMIVSLKIGILLLIYQVFAWIYSAEPLRLKRFPIIGTFVSSVASWLLVVMGFLLISPDTHLERFPFVLQWFFFLAFTLVLPIKDLKDIAGDRANNVWTIPVLLGEQRARIFIGVSIWLMYGLSISVFRESRLLIPAFLCGWFSYEAMQRAKNSEKGKLTFRTLPWWILGGVFCYGLFVVYFAMKVVS